MARLAERETTLATLSSPSLLLRGVRAPTNNTVDILDGQHIEGRGSPWGFRDAVIHHVVITVLAGYVPGAAVSVFTPDRRGESPLFPRRAFSSPRHLSTGVVARPRETANDVPGLNRDRLSTKVRVFARSGAFSGTFSPGRG